RKVGQKKPGEAEPHRGQPATVFPYQHGQKNEVNHGDFRSEAAMKCIQYCLDETSERIPWRSFNREPSDAEVEKPIPEHDINCRYPQEDEQMNSPFPAIRRCNSAT